MADDPKPGAAPAMRSAVLRGGAAMAAREALGLVVRLGGIIVLTRLLGPTQFGLYAGSLVIVTVLTVVASLGAEVYLPRSEAEPTREAYDQTFTSLLFSGFVLSLAMVAFVVLVGGVLLPDSRYGGPLTVMSLILPVTAARLVPRVMLERRFEWPKVAAIDLGGDVALYVVAVALAVAGAGVWAPVGGYLAWQTWSMLSACVLARYRPRLALSVTRLRTLAGYGLTLSTSTLLNRGEDLINPLVVGSFLGPTSVGFASFATRMGDTVAFPVRASWRLALVAFGQVQGDKARLRRGIQESMGLQVLTLGVAFLGFCLLAPLVIPPVFGDQWRPALVLLPFVAVRYIVLAVNGPQASALYVLGRQAAVIKLAVLRATSAAAVAVILVPAIGLEGFGFALLAPTVSLVGFFLVTRRELALSYREPLAWAAAFVPGCFAPSLGTPWAYLLVLTMVPVLVQPLPRRRLRDYAGHLRGARRSRASKLKPASP